MSGGGFSDAGQQLAVYRDALHALAQYLASAKTAALRLVDGREAAVSLQHKLHGFAWLWTYAEALNETLAWAEALQADGGLAPAEALVLRVGFAEYVARIVGGIPMSQTEYARPSDLGLATAAQGLQRHPAIQAVLASAGSGVHHELAASICWSEFGRSNVQEPALEAMRDQVRRFVTDRVSPHAQAWHASDALIPMDVVDGLSELGVFGLAIPETHGGLGLGAVPGAIVSEELCRGYLGAGSLATRSEIAAQLLLRAGSAAQRERYLPRIASGELLATAVFTEPDTGSDLANITTRAELVTRDGVRTWRLHGAKTWITHAARADLMMILARTDRSLPGHRGLSILAVEKPRGEPQDPFPAPGMSGTEIPVLGYRGMKEYEIAFDGLEAPFDALVGGEGDGFKNLMATFEAARIQTAARAVGVAQSALELGLEYAQARRQFGRAIFEFPRVHGKLAVMAAEVMMARQLTYAAAREKDSGQRCDIPAGMAKLLASAVAWSAADCALQVHGGNGFALEQPISRVLCDARVLSIFEGASEIQADVIARGLLKQA